jgi:hypothetical protein
MLKLKVVGTSIENELLFADHKFVAILENSPSTLVCGAAEPIAKQAVG